MSRRRQPFSLEKRWWVSSKQDDVKIIKALQGRQQSINFYYWSQRKHLNQISYYMNEHKLSAEAAFYAYKNEHDSA